MSSERTKAAELLESDRHDLTGQLGSRTEKTPNNPRPNTHTLKHTHLQEL